MAILEDLAPDVLESILSKLPAKVASKCKLVLKSWNLIISNRRFICNFAIKRTDGVLVRLGLFLVYFKFEDAMPMRVGDHDNILGKYFSLRNGCIGGYCNGLMLMYDHFTISIWNPAMKKRKTLPRRPKNSFRKNIEIDEDEVPCGKGYYSRVVCFTAYGLGFDESKEDYKAVKINFPFHSTSTYHSCQVQIYSLNTNKWRSVELETRVLPDNSSPGLYLDKFLYWEERKCRYGEPYNNILCFDLMTESFVEVPKFLPTYESGLGIMLGYLCIPHVRKDHSLDLWVLRENIWYQFAKIPIVTLFGEVRPWKTLCLTHNGEVVLMMGESLYTVNIKNNNITWMMIPDHFPKANINITTAFSYAYGLVDPTKQNGIGLRIGG